MGDRTFLNRTIAQAGRPCHDGGGWIKSYRTLRMRRNCHNCDYFFLPAIILENSKRCWGFIFDIGLKYFFFIRARSCIVFMSFQAEMT
jgi:hypothetical protein